ncbi:stage II sporulation protein M [Candidatus Woesearchaeota archaeon]|nr:stage II sporulation protein M [Candidatus Woesearchaeota archaeon]
MVLEYIFPVNWLEQRTRYAFIMGVVYTIVGVSISSLLFRRNPALVSVAFISLLMLPELYKIFDIEQQQVIDSPRFSLKTLFTNHWDVTKIYIFLFLGVLLTYSVATIVLPNYETNTLFRDQLDIRGYASSQGRHAIGNAILFTPSLFKELIQNNFNVLVACFLIAFLTGNGGIFIIVWNASVWGTIFGITAKNAAIATGVNPFSLFFMVMGIVSLHMMLEAMAYFLSAISASLLSKVFTNLRFNVFRLHQFRKVLAFTGIILLISLVFLVIGAFVETLVLDNAETYTNIIRLSLSV